MKNRVHEADIQIMNSLDRYHNKLLDFIMIWFSRLGIPIIYALFAGTLIYLLTNDYKPGLVILGMLVINVVINEIIRFSVKRDRPFVYNKKELIVKKPWTASFPSGHANFAWSLAIYLCFLNTYGGILFCVFALIISMSRVYLNVHHPSDVIVGSLIGIIIGFLVKMFTL